MRVLISSIILSILFIPMAIDDWKDNYVDGRLCLVAWILTGLAWFFCGYQLWTGIVLLVLVIIFYSKFEIPLFGDADILPIAMYIAVFLSVGTGRAIWIMYPLCLLACLIPYAKIYCKAHGSVWKPFCGIAMPMLPCFAVGWWLATISYAIYAFVL